MVAASAAAFAGGVTISSPGSGVTVASPVHVVAQGSSSYPIVAVAVYVDNNLKTKISGSKVDTYLSLASGGHSMTAQIWDSTGAVYKSSRSFTVSGGSTSGGTTYSNIDQMTGWQNCTVCAGIGGSGSVGQYSMTQNISSPSMDGRSAKFWLGGTSNWANALWWKQLGANSGATHFTYDLYMYVKSLNAQAYEFDVNQSTGGRKYIFGTQCSVKGDKVWDVWDTANARWVPTGISCLNLKTYSWNHVVWEFHRANGKTYFDAVTVNGVKSYVNRSYYSKAVSANEINVAFQLDMQYTNATTAWLDKITLKYW